MIQTVIGSAKMLRETGEHPVVLREQVTSPGGTTASALRELERDGLVTRREYLEVPVRVEYSPTDDCRALLPILEQLSDWAEARM